MKKLLATLMICSSVVALAAEDNIPGPDGCIRNPDGTLKRFTKEEFRKLPQEVRSAMGREFFRLKLGPRVEKPNSAVGYFKYINCSKLLKSEELSDAIKPINQYSLIRLEAATGEAPEPAAAKDALAKAGANAGVFIVDSKTLPRIMLAPEDGWAFVNAEALNDGNPDHKTLVKRVNIELVRAFTYICGSANDERSVIMSSVSSVADIDAMPSARFLPTNIEQMGKQLSKFGIEPRVVKPYKTACEEGWAHKPTNEVEKAIWDKALDAKEKGPVNGLKILPPKK